MDFWEFRDRISEKYNLNLCGYKEKQLKRRIEHLMNCQGFDDFQRYFRALITDEDQKNKFLDKLTINVSEFFRNKEIFDRLEGEVIPLLINRKSGNLRIWSAACSNGAEPYSIAIILDKYQGNIHTIDATDIDERVLMEAKEAKYRKELIKGVSEERLKNYFTPIGDLYQLKDFIKNRVSFKKHDLLRDKFDKDYDLIVCRNVTIYFTKETQDFLYKSFAASLKPGGILFIGATESILNYRQLGFEKISPWFYQKPF
ncbi:MAG: protein-glutamate O-methyltransferase CheR [Bacillota bacterium]